MPDRSSLPRTLRSERQLLSKRELEVLACAADGYTVPETAQKLFVAPETIKSHRRHILSKLGARNIAHAVAIAFFVGILEIERTTDG